MLYFCFAYLSVNLAAVIPDCTAGDVLVLAGASLTGVLQTLQSAAFWAFSRAVFSLATASLSCQHIATVVSTLSQPQHVPFSVTVIRQISHFKLNFKRSVIASYLVREMCVYARFNNASQTRGHPYKLYKRHSYDSSTGSPATQATFYIHCYHHGAIDITRFGNERMTLNFLIGHQNLKIKTF